MSAPARYVLMCSFCQALPGQERRRFISVLSDPNIYGPVMVLAVTTEKRGAQTTVVSLFVTNNKKRTAA